MRSLTVAAWILALPAISAAGEVGFELPFGFDFEVSNGEGTWRLSENLDAITDIAEGRAGEVLIFAEATVGESDWEMQFSTDASQVPTTSGPASAAVSSAFTITNNNAGVQHFVATVIQAAFVSPSPTEILGSHSGTVGDNPSIGDGAMLAAFGGSSLYDAQIDGASVQTLFNDPFSVAAPAFGTNSYGPGNYGFTPGQPAVLSDIRIINDFTLSGMDNASMTSTFVVRVPSPGAAALFGVSGLVALRRRRR